MLSLVIILYSFGVSLQTNEEYRIVDHNGNRLSWYKQLKYAFKFVETNRFWAFPVELDLVNEPVDKLNDKYWFNFVTRNGSSCISNFDVCAHKTLNGQLFLATISGQPIVDLNVVDGGSHLLGICLDCDFIEKDIFNSTQYPYELFAEIKDFQFETLPQDVLKQKSESSIIFEQIIDNSKSPVGQSSTIKYNYKKISDLSIKHSNITTNLWKAFTKVGVNAKYKFNVAIDAGGVQTDTYVEGGFEKTVETNTSNGMVTNNSEETAIEESTTVYIEPFKTVKVTVYQYKLKDVEWKYKAKLKVYGNGPQWENNGKITPDVLSVLLQKQLSDLEQDKLLQSNTLEFNDDSHVYEQNGTMKTSMGLKSYTTFTDLKTGRLIRMYLEGERF